LENFWVINRPLFKRPVTTTAGFLATAEMRRIFGTPTMGQFVRSGFAPVPGYQPLAQTIGIVAAGTTTLTVSQSAAVVLAGTALKSGLIFFTFEGGVLLGSGINAGIVQPLLGPVLGITGCEGWGAVLEKTWIAATGQRWKVYAMFGLLVLTIVWFAGTASVLEYVPATVGAGLLLILFGLIVAFISWTLWGLSCPFCGDRVLFTVLRRLPQDSSIHTGLFLLTDCPACKRSLLPPS